MAKRVAPTFKNKTSLKSRRAEFAWFRETVELLLNMERFAVAADERFENAIRWSLISTAAVLRRLQILSGNSQASDLASDMTHILSEFFDAFSLDADAETVDALRSRIDVFLSICGESFDIVSGPSLLAELYENVLACRPEKGENGFVLIEWDKVKKRSGSFYTPPSLAALTVEKALHLVVENDDGTVKTPSEILALCIVDPAVGGGSMLCAAMAYLAETLYRSYRANDVTHGTAGESAGTPSEVEASAVEASAKRNLVDGRVSTTTSNASYCRQLILQNCLYGVDLNPQAVELCILVLLLGSGVAPVSPSLIVSLRERIRCGNALIGAWRVETQPSHQEQASKFFHWAIEFSDVFARANPGFDAAIGNPPWEIEKPNSREFFSRFDKRFWSYGKQQALLRQEELCSDPAICKMWADRVAAHEAFAVWVKRTFVHQGKSDLNAYKLFLEQAYSVIRNDGVMSFIVPAGLYSDLGARELRRLFLQKCRWKSIVGFENRNGLFDIHRSFKFCVATIQKSGTTESLDAEFLKTDPAATPNDPIVYKADMVRTLSPSTFSFVEFEHPKDQLLLSKIYANNSCLKESSWDVAFEREFDMTNDSKLFVARDRLESSGFRADQYGHWLAGKWMEVTTGQARAHSHAEDQNIVFSRDGQMCIHIKDVSDIALPLYEGRMIGQFDFREKQWVSGKGRTADWQHLTGDKFPNPQYLMMVENHPSWSNGEIKCGFLGVGSPTNARSMIASAINNWPCGNSVPTIRTTHGAPYLFDFIACLNSYVFDYVLRCRMSGNNLNYFLVEETALPSPATLRHAMEAAGATSLVANLNLNHVSFARHWQALVQQDLEMNWICDGFERRMARAKLDAGIAMAYGLNHDDLSWILRGTSERSSYGSRAVKGFWRSDKGIADELKHATLTLHMFEHLLNAQSQQSHSNANQGQDIVIEKNSSIRTNINEERNCHAQAAQIAVHAQRIERLAGTLNSVGTKI